MIEALLREPSRIAVRRGLDHLLPRLARAIEVAQVLQRQAFLVVRVGNLVAARIGTDGQVARFHGLVVFAGLHVGRADVHLRVVSEIGLGKALDVVGEAEDGQIVLAGVVVSHRRVEQLLRRDANGGVRRAAGWRRRPWRGGGRLIDGVAGGRPRADLLHRGAQRVDLLGERADAHVVIIQLLADYAHVVGQVVDHQLLIGKCLARRFGLLIETRVDGFECFGHRPDQVLQLLRLLLQHAKVGHQLLMFLVGGARRRSGGDDKHAEDGAESCLFHRLTSR